jgi:type II secretory pathway component PulF
VARLLERGATPGEAFARVPGSLPREGLVFLRMGWDGPRLGASLRGLARRRAEWKPFRGVIAMRLAYLSWTLLAMQAVLAFFLVMIAPQMERIIADFGLGLPAVSRWTIAAGWLLLESPAALVVLALDLLALLILVAAFSDPIEWGAGPVDWLLLRRHGATVLRALSGEVAMGRPMPEALERLAGSYPPGAVRRRVARARSRVDRGWMWERSLAASGLIRRVDAAALEAASRSGNLAWAQGDLADGLDRRSGARQIALCQALYPLAVLAVTVPVFVLAVSYFLPLVMIIQARAL